MRAAYAAVDAAHNSSAANAQCLTADLAQWNNWNIATQFLKRQDGQLKELSLDELAQVTADVHRAQQDCPGKPATGFITYSTDISNDALQQLWINGDLSGLARAAQCLAQRVLQFRVRNQGADGPIGTNVALCYVSSQSDTHLFRDQHNIAFPA